uniref:Non-homologous end-joining factor 1 n=1 Tax=Clastoptera arizonana TaxID=38151 RepID=A0A1B6DSA9_9HEMI
MWKPISFNTREFLLKLRFLESLNAYQIDLTNFINLWQQQISEEDLIQTCKKVNPLIYAKPKVLSRHIMSLLDTENDNVVKNMEEKDNQIVLNLHMMLDRVCFKYQFILELQPAECLYKEFTFPMVLMISELQKQKEIMSELLARKDLEITQYKLEGAKLIRKLVQTKPFDQDTFNRNCLESISETKAVLEQNPSKIFSKSFANLYQQVITASNKSKTNTDENSNIESEMENTVQILLEENRTSSKKKSMQVENFPIKDSKISEVKTEIPELPNIIPKKKKKCQVVLNL